MYMHTTPSFPSSVKILNDMLSHNGPWRQTNIVLMNGEDEPSGKLSADERANKKLVNKLQTD
jgi:hypothetical protein